MVDIYKLLSKILETLNLGDVYSKDGEKRVGTWIDGKPIYRRVFSITTPSDISWKNVFALSTYSIKQIVNLNGYFISRDNRIMYLGSSYSENQDYYTALSIFNGYLQIRTGHPAFQNRPCDIYVEYTKTID